MKNQTKWYNNTEMVGSFLIFLPPVGLYGLFRSETIDSKWKTVAYGTIMLVCVLLIMYYLS